MVKLNKIYTRTGDDGTAGLVDGSRVSKAGPRMAAIGEVGLQGGRAGSALADIRGQRLGCKGRAGRGCLPDGFTGGLDQLAREQEIARDQLPPACEQPDGSRFRLRPKPRRRARETRAPDSEPLSQRSCRPVTAADCHPMPVYCRPVCARVFCAA